jgi:hypothetical protein
MPANDASPKVFDTDSTGHIRTGSTGLPQFRTLREWAGFYADKQRCVEPTVYTPPDLVAGHVPDVCVTGSPDPNKFGGWWLPMERDANSAVAGYEVGHMKAKPGQPVNFFTVGGKDPLTFN